MKNGMNSIRNEFQLNPDSYSQGAGLPKYNFRSTQTTEGLILEYGREKPADQRQIVRRVEMWYTSKDIGPFSGIERPVPAHF